MKKFILPLIIGLIAISCYPQDQKEKISFYVSHIYGENYSTGEIVEVRLNGSQHVEITGDKIITDCKIVYYITSSRESNGITYYGLTETSTGYTCTGEFRRNPSILICNFSFGRVCYGDYNPFF